MASSVVMPGGVSVSARIVAGASRKCLAMNRACNFSHVSARFSFRQLMIRTIIPSATMRLRQSSSPEASRRFYAQSAAAAAALEIELIPCLRDNYAYLLRDPISGVIGVVDPSTAEPVINLLEKRGLKLTHILNTHHHWDHTGGNKDLKERYGAQIVAPPGDKIPDIDVPLGDGDTWMLGEHAMHVIGTPGHTRGHVSYYFPDSKAVFTGDTLFSIGCGKLFEGSAEQMWTSLSKLASLPGETKVYCGHEYTLSNAKFAISLEPSNQALQSRFHKVKLLRDKGLATIPSSVEEERRVNPFLRPSSAEIRRNVNLPDEANEVDVFAAVRKAKDNA